MTDVLVCVGAQRWVWEVGVSPTVCFSAWGEAPAGTGQVLPCPSPGILTGLFRTNFRLEAAGWFELCIPTLRGSVLDHPQHPDREMPRPVPGRGSPWSPHITWATIKWAWHWSCPLGRHSAPEGNLRPPPSPPTPNPHVALGKRQFAPGTWRPQFSLLLPWPCWSRAAQPLLWPPGPPPSPPATGPPGNWVSSAVAVGGSGEREGGVGQPRKSSRKGVLTESLRPRCRGACPSRSLLG